MTDQITVVIGHDYREQAAYDVCKRSIERRSSRPVNIVRCQERDLRLQGIYNRPYRVAEDGQFWDERDERPFSTAFAFARFLTPLLARAHGQPRGFALFCDCDFLFLRDPALLFRHADSQCAVQVVKHFHEPVSGLKMDGVSQQAYSRKNWSSLILWNLDHPAHDALTTKLVNHAPGKWLHGFGWLDDDLIGGLPEDWNWLVGHSPTIHDAPRGASVTPGALHFTDGGPWFDSWKGSAWDQLWLDEWSGMNRLVAGVAGP